MEAVIRQAVTDVLTQLSIEVGDFVVEHPADITHGDYATNVAMAAAKAVGKNPRDLAEEVVAKLMGEIEYVDRIEIAGPGFINFFLVREFFAANVAAAAHAGADWGRNDTQSEQEVVVEYTSPNLFKPLHVGNLVGNIIGESFTRLFEFSGATVRRMNYPSDIGLPVAKAVWGLQSTGGNPDDINDLGRAYQAGNAAYESSEEDKAAIVAINKALYENSDTNLTALREAGIKTSKARIDELCAILGTHFDGVITESEASVPGAAKVKQHIGDIFEESDGAVVYKGEQDGLHTRVFLNAKGLPTYEAKDIGHFTLKHNTYPNWTRSIIVTGGEQAEYFKVVYAVLKKLFPEAASRDLEHIPTGFLTLSTGKMSSREGNVLTGESLLEELMEAARAAAADSRTDDVELLAKQVAVAALKYQILRQNIGTNIIFDKAKALSFEGDSGPYLQYTYARIQSVLRKADAAGIKPDVKAAPETPYEIEKILYRFPAIVEQALNERSPHTLVTFITEVASEFNRFYAKEAIADVADEQAGYKVMIAMNVAATLKNGLWLVGAEVPEQM